MDTQCRKLTEEAPFKDGDQEGAGLRQGAKEEVRAHKCTLTQ
jgi:hypothetical protein